jgi:hypothetical protein
MGSLVIKDLAEDAELDSQALKAVSGGRSGLGGLGSGARIQTAVLEESKLIRGLVKGGLIERDAADGDLRTD